MKCKTCDKEFKPKLHAHNIKFCSVTCRNKSYQPARTIWQRERFDRLAIQQDPNKIQCLICGRWYVQVGSHVYNRHDMTAREYREYHNLEVKRGIVPAYYRKLKGDQALENGTYQNLKVGKKFWFKPGDPKAGKYQRSPITMVRLRNLHKLRKPKRLNAI